MRSFGLAVIFLASFSFAAAQQAGKSPNPSDSSKGQPATQDQSSTPSNGTPVDAGKVTGSIFHSDYFKFSFELPKDWKALDDAARMAANQALLQSDRERASQRPAAAGKKSLAPDKKTPVTASVNAPENYSLLVASSSAVDSLQSPVLPRINVWANKRMPPLDTPADHVQFLFAGRRTRPLIRPHEVVFGGQTFMRGSVITANGEYHSQYVTVIGDYLVGFDFRALSERELVEMTETMKTIKFQ